MKNNEGSIERVLRILFGLILISLVFIGPKSNLGFIGVVPLITGLIGWCPLYRIIGINTCTHKNK